MRTASGVRGVQATGVSDRPIRFACRRMAFPVVWVAVLLWLTPSLFALVLLVYGWTAGAMHRLVFPENLGREQAGVWAVELAARCPGLSALDWAVLVFAAGLLVRLVVARLWRRDAEARRGKETDNAGRDAGPRE